MAGARWYPDTIVAQATPVGHGAVALIRISGPRACEIASSLADSGERQGRATWPERQSQLRVLRRPESGEVLDHALVTMFRGPRSYTGEDLVEISTHGGFVIPASVVEACTVLGARHARPGEFTQRAYLNGKLDLTQAEAVGDLVAANSEMARDVALHQLERGLGARIADLRDDLIGLSALLVHHIDFPEEDDAPTPIGTIASRAETVVRGIERLLATAPGGELLRRGAVTVFAGRPNAGKSSLFNALLGTERAIVTDEEGTTRDAIEAVVSIDGFPFRFVDTAGLRTATGRVERLGIEIAQRYLAGADLVVYCREWDCPQSDDENAFLQPIACPVVKVRTKWDLADDVAVVEDDEIAVSVVSGVGLGDLKRQLRNHAFTGIARRRVPVVTTRRQRELLEEAHAEIAGFGEAVVQGIPPEVASAHLKTAESALEAILGIVATDDVLDRVFRDFCIGK